MGTVNISDNTIGTVTNFLAPKGLHLWESAGITIFPAYTSSGELLCAQMFVLSDGEKYLAVRFDGDLFAAVQNASAVFGETAFATKKGETFHVITLG